MSKQQENSVLLGKNEQDVPGIVTITTMRKNMSDHDNDQDNDQDNGTTSMDQDMFSDVQMTSSSSLYLIDQGNRDVPLGGSISSFSEADRNVPRPSSSTTTTTVGGDSSSSCAFATNVPPAEDELNDFFDSDFLLFMSDDPLASTTLTRTNEKPLLCNGPQEEFHHETPSQEGALPSLSSTMPVPLIQEVPMVSSSSSEDQTEFKVETTRSLNAPESKVAPAPISVSSVTSSFGEEDETQQKQTTPTTVSEKENSNDTDTSTANGRKRKSLTAEQKANGRRERNREHAKRSRKRKKVFVDTLQEMIVQLKSENEKMRSCMTQHFGRTFVQDLLSSNTPASISSPAIQELPPKPSNASSGFETICPILTPSHSSSTVTTAARANITSSHSCQTVVSPTTTPSTSSEQNNNYVPPVSQPGSLSYAASSCSRWLAEQNTPKHLRRKNVMYKDKLSILLPKHNSSIVRTNYQHTLLPKELPPYS